MIHVEQLTLAEHYSTLAARFREKASGEKSRPRKNKWKQLADCYRRLAEDCRREPRLVQMTP
jgi:hypothetical protein